MNWLDWLLAVLLGWAAFHGFRRGFIIEVCSLLALVLGIWVAAHYSDHFGAAIGLSPERSAIGFVVTFVAVLLAVSILGRVLTKFIDLALLGVPNKLAGLGFAVLRSAFVISIMLNLLLGWSRGSLPDRAVRDGSSLHAPLRALAPMIIPDLGETKWVMKAMDQLKLEAKALWEAEP